MRRLQKQLNGIKITFLRKMAKDIFSGSRVLVTGGCGFIGSHLARAAFSHGAEVLVCTDPEGSCDRLSSDLQITKKLVSVTDYEKLREVIREYRPQYVFHAAGTILRPTFYDDATRTLFNVHVNGSLNLVAALSGSLELKRVVALGSLDEYSGKTFPLVETDQGIPSSVYGLSKLLSTKSFEYAAQKEKLPAVVLRPAAVYGPGQGLGMFIPSLISSCLKRKEFPMTSGIQKRAFIFIDDLVDAFFHAATENAAVGEIFNLSGKESIQVKTIAEIVSSTCGASELIEYGKIADRANDSLEFSVSIEKAEKILKWKPHTDIKEGLVKTIEWYQNSL